MIESIKREHKANGYQTNGKRNDIDLSILVPIQSTRSVYCTGAVVSDFFFFDVCIFNA